jgi:hypothetical protein
MLEDQMVSEWLCASAAHTEAQVFSSEKEFKEHLTTDHGNSLSEQQLSKLAQRNKRSAFQLFNNCPFCDFVQGPSDISDREAQDILQRHIAEHLQALSLLSLPKKVDDGFTYASSEESSRIAGERSSPDIDALSFDLDLPISDVGVTKGLQANMSEIGEAGFVLGIISSIVEIIDVTKQMYEIIEDDAGLPTNFKKSAKILPLITKILKDAGTYIEKVDKDTADAFKSTMDDCKVLATQLQELFAKVMPEEDISRWDRYRKAAQMIAKDGRVETLVGGFLASLQLLTTRFPEATTARGKEQLAKAAKEVSKMEPSLPDGFEEMAAHTNYGSGPQNNNTGRGNQIPDSGQQFIGGNDIGMSPKSYL